MSRMPGKRFEVQTHEIKNGKFLKHYNQNPTLKYNSLALLNFVYLVLPSQSVAEQQVQQSPPLSGVI